MFLASKKTIRFVFIHLIWLIKYLSYLHFKAFILCAFTTWHSFPNTNNSNCLENFLTFSVVCTTSVTIKNITDWATKEKEKAKSWTSESGKTHDGGSQSWLADTVHRLHEVSDSIFAILTHWLAELEHLPVDAVVCGYVVYPSRRQHQSHHCPHGSDSTFRRLAPPITNLPPQATGQLPSTVGQSQLARWLAARSHS